MTKSTAKILTLAEFKPRFDIVLRAELNERIAATSRVTRDESVRRTLQYVRMFVLGGGKRFRPYVAYLAYITAGGRDVRSALRVFTALELLHAFCLIQDDVIDCASERRGIRTVHEEIRGVLGQRNRVGDLRHVGEGQAVLCGDLLAGWSEDIMYDVAMFSRSRQLASQAVWRTLRNEVILGQLLDVDASTRPSISTKLVREKIVLKTARYSFVRPMQLGLALAGGSRSLFTFADRFGTALGIAFQTQDDLLDLTGDQTTVGKSLLADLRQHQHTPFTQYILTKAPYIYRKQLLTWFGGDVQQRDHGAVVEIFERSGAIVYGQQQIETLLNEATSVLQRARLGGKYHDAFFAFLTTIRTRVS